MTFEVMVDWDATNWADDPDFSQSYDDISGDVDTGGVVGLSWERGKQREEGNAPAATLTVNLRKGLCQRYSPFTTDADLTGKIRPWLPIRVRAYHGGAYIAAYFGFIERISINPSLDAQSVSFYCTDGTDLLARQLITQDPTDKEICSDGEAIHKILDAVGWNDDRRDIDEDGGNDLFAYPESYEY
ncbi:MAG: hypothetical protein KKC55_14945 [Gammaproteobacteria bacterium]|nr:hypothetical protein [Gammaproteobacteria bacterium]